jgi:predicted  nucleic acid-binding Zn-ribbon protein
MATSQSAGSLQAELESKSATIESMEMEISNLRAHIDSQARSDSSHTEQVQALEEKLGRAERAAGAAQRELLDARKNLERLSEKAVKEGTARISTETRLRTLTRDAEASSKTAAGSLKRIETLEKKLAAVTTLHKESDTRRRETERERDAADKDAADVRRRLAALDTENARLRDERDRIRKRDATGVDDAGLDELEDEARAALEARVRMLEAELSDARRGVWRERKRMLDGTDADDAAGDHHGLLSRSPGGGFDEVDLVGGIGRRGSVKGAVGTGRVGSSFKDVLSSGISAFTGGGGGYGGAPREGGDEADEDLGFDEDAFRAAQEEDGRRRVEHVKAVKRALKDWQGWRLDIVDERLGGGGGAGEVFDI